MEPNDIAVVKCVCDTIITSQFPLFSFQHICEGNKIE